jgi:Family of unknown function (DUF695)
VKALEKSATGERFAVLDGKTASGQPMVATINLAVKRLDHLLMDQSLTIRIKLTEATPQGLTSSAEAATLNALEDELMRALGRDAVYIGRETGQGERVLHFHVATAGPAEQRTRAWASGHPERQVSITAGPDPRWEILRRW